MGLIGNKSGTEAGTRADTGSNPINPSDQDIIAAILCCIVSASVAIHTPITREQGRNTGSAGAVRVAVEESEVCFYNFLARVQHHRELTDEAGLASRDDGQ